MASGDLLCAFTPYHAELPSSNYATLDAITAATGLRPVLDFDSATDETAIFTGTMPNNYSAATGVTVKIKFAMDTTNTGTKNVVWDAAFERCEDAVALGAAGNDFAAVNSVTAVVDNTANNLEASTGTITFTAGADMDSVVSGDVFRLKITRDANNGSDDATGDAQVIAVEVWET